MKIKYDKLVGPLVSLLVHCVVLFLAYKFIRFVIEDQNSQIEVMVMDVESVDLEEFKQELDAVEEIDTFDDNVVSDAPVEAEAPEMDQPTEVTDDFANLDVMSSFDSPIVMKGLYGGRSAGGRAAMLSKYGNKYSAKTEKSVLAALKYLKEHQNKDGSFSRNKSHKLIGVTGLALLTFLAHGETPNSDEYGATVEKAIRWLLSQQDANGSFTGNTYAHSIAVYAIAESYAMTQIPKLKPAVEKGVNVIVNGLILDKTKKVGSMRPVPGLDSESASEVTYARLEYAYKKVTRMDTSVLGWNAQALKAAKLAGSKNPKLNTAIAQVVNGLIYAQNRQTGQFRYSDANSNKAGTPAMTGVGVLCLQLLGNGKTPEVSAGLKTLQDMPVTLKDGKGKLYSYYYITQAMFHKGSSMWSKWNNKFAPVFIKAQNPDGSFTDADKHHVGKEYTTSLGALTLMVYYRNLPTFQEKAVEEEVEKVSDDVEIEII